MNRVFSCSPPVLGCAALLACLLPKAALAEAPECSLAGISDETLVRSAKETVSLLATFSPEKARAQFEQVMPSLEEAARKPFTEDILGTELRAIEETKRTQTFQISDKEIVFGRRPALGLVEVRIPGRRQKTIQDHVLPPDDVVYTVKYRAFCEAGREPGAKISDVRLGGAPLAMDESTGSVRPEMPRRRHIPEDYVSTAETAHSMQMEAYGDLIQAFKNDIDMAKRENAELNKVTTDLLKRVQILERELGELKKRPEALLYRSSIAQRDETRGTNP